MNGSGAPGPDGFGGSFYHTYWDIIADDVFNSVSQFFIQGWLLPNLNSNLVVLIPKFPGVDRIENYRPIALANFQFKIITKVLADRLACIAPKILSENQRGFIRERHISDCICIASEAINMLDKKNFGGNLALKIDIKKAFDTLDWNFLLQVLQSFGFDSKFCSWVKVILNSAKLSFSVNGRPVGYFNCKGVFDRVIPFPLSFFVLRKMFLVEPFYFWCRTVLSSPWQAQRVSQPPRMFSMRTTF